MYDLNKYKKIFEQSTTEQPQPAQYQNTPGLSGKNVNVLVLLSEQDITELDQIIDNNSELKLFIRPAQLVDKKDPNKKIGEVSLVLAIANSNEKDAKFPETNQVDLSKSMIFKVYPKQLNLEEIESGPISVQMRVRPDDASTAVTVIFTEYSGVQNSQNSQTEPVSQSTEPQEVEEQPTTQDIALTTGDMASAPQKNESLMENQIKSFDQFLNEAKKEKWIDKIDMKKGALKKELGKKKDEKLTKEDIQKSEEKLKAKDKDKKKPGLQLDKKDAKTHKRNILAKNLMKASGAISESKKVEIAEIKQKLVKLNEAFTKLAEKNKEK
jgi:hypothetical protein